MIQITTRGGHDCPEFICDACQQKLAKDDWIYWRNEEKEGDTGTVLCFHDSECLLKAKPHQEFSAMRIGTFLHYLCQNTGFFPSTGQPPQED